MHRVAGFKWFSFILLPQHPYRAAAYFPKQPATYPPDDPDGSELAKILLVEMLIKRAKLVVAEP